MTSGAVALVAGLVGLAAVLAVQTGAKAQGTRALARETQANQALAATNTELARSKAAVQARYDLAVEAIRTFHTGVSEDFLLKQDQFSPLPFSKQILIISAGTGGFLDDLPVDQVRDFEKELYRYVDSTNPGLLRAIMEKKILDDQLKAQIQDVIQQAKQQFVSQREAVAK